VCPNPSCGAVYHLTAQPPRVPGVCDRCGTLLVQREDDKEETVRKRLQIFHSSLADLLEHYRHLGLLREVCGIGGIETIYENIVRSLRPH
jgi:adenylate kinase